MAVGPYEFLEQFQEFVDDYREGDTDEKRCEQFVHAFGHAPPAHAMEKVGGRDTWDLMEKVMDWDCEGEMPSEIDDLVDDALKELKDYKGMLSEDVLEAKRSSKKEDKEMDDRKIASELYRMAGEIIAAEVENKEDLKNMAREIAKEAFGEENVDEDKIDGIVDEAISDSTDEEGNVDWENAAGIVVGAYQS